MNLPQQPTTSLLAVNVLDLVAVGFIKVEELSACGRLYFRRSSQHSLAIAETTAELNSIGFYLLELYTDLLYWITRPEAHLLVLDLMLVFGYYSFYHQHNS